VGDVNLLVSQEVVEDREINRRSAGVADLFEARQPRIPRILGGAQRVTHVQLRPRMTKGNKRRLNSLTKEATEKYEEVIRKKVGWRPPKRLRSARR